MKQHITIEQFKDLNTDQQNKLLDWYTTTDAFKEEADLGLFPVTAILLDIGMMTEFLNEHRKDKNNLDFWLIINDAGSSVHCGLHGDPNPSEDFTDYNIGLRPELCDALWDAIKEILEK